MCPVSGAKPCCRTRWRVIGVCWIRHRNTMPKEVNVHTPSCRCDHIIEDGRIEAHNNNLVRKWNGNT